VRALSLASQLLLRTIGKIAGSEIVDDAIAFFQAFGGMEQGFKERAQSVDRLLAEAQTAFVLVTTPRRDAIVEATEFAERLDELHHRFDALIVNRMHPDFGAPIDLGGLTPTGPWHDLIVNLDELATLAQREEELVADLVARVAPAPVVRVPMLESDVHDLSGLTEVAEYLLR
jgi:anion-transporting  ArsA/GET3 family ATPase